VPEKILPENFFLGLRKFLGWVTLDDLDLEPVKILCEKIFCRKVFWDFENFWGVTLTLNPEKIYSETISG